MYSSGTNRARWAYIHSGSSHWGKIFAINAARDGQPIRPSFSAPVRQAPNPSVSVVPRKPSMSIQRGRGVFTAGPDGKCTVCGCTIERHTPAIKQCPRGEPGGPEMRKQ